MVEIAHINGIASHYRFRQGHGTPNVFLNSLDTDFRIWDDVIQTLDADIPVVCVDKRGHVLTDDGPITMDLLIKDVAALVEDLGVSDALICGVSVGGMIAQGLAASRPHLVPGLALCCTGAKIGDAQSWTSRIDAIEKNGIASLSDAILERWFSPDFMQTGQADLAAYRNMLVRTSVAGHTGVCAAIAETDFTEQCKHIMVPTVCIAGADDRATPLALVHELAKNIANASFQIMDRCGHLPCIEQPDMLGNAITHMYRGIP
ncbi:MAG: 3-oxoadipate enol-lactonase [Litoreibacter sp.]